jgi:hypothetical protein
MLEARSTGSHTLAWRIGEALDAFRLLRGPLLASLAASVAFYLPDQIRELYRIMAAEYATFEVAREAVMVAVALLLLAFCFWWVSYVIVRRLGHTVESGAIIGPWLLRLAPPIIGVLPLFAVALGMYSSIPGAKELEASASGAWESFNLALADTMGRNLSRGAIGWASVAVVLLVTAYWWQARQRRANVQKQTNEQRTHGFFSFAGFLVSVALISAMTALLVLFPFAVPSMLGTIPLVALFFVCIMLMVGQFTFWHERSNVPFFILLATAGLAFTAFDLTDNHEVAAIKDPSKAASADVVNAEPKDIWDHFVKWYEARPGREHFKEVYPVYIIAAQGGGIYAAYHTAMLLARIQDACPEFSNHAFAISSVSGGSVGASVFASLAKAMAADPHPGASPANPCPDLEANWRKLAETPGSSRGKMEQATRAILSSDFLSPLAAGALFPDFTQQFLPFQVGQFDRSRWLDRAFEGAWRQAGIKGPNPLEESVLKLWSPEGKAPALLINTTEADSGRRTVIAPFRVLQAGWEFAEYLAKDEPDAGARRQELLHFPLWNKGQLGAAKFDCQGRDIPLSTAAGLSARFPWLSPAGSLTTNCRVQRGPEGGKWQAVSRKVRLVDGGYFDNSGVETALDVIDYLQRETGRAVIERKWPRFSFHLIVLTTNEFPIRAAYGMGDAVEPIRALLSTREARAQISINRARRMLALGAAVDRETETANKLGQLMGSFAAVDRVHEATFSSPLYTIPLGWRLSNASRDAIDAQSGRVWDCFPNTFYKQSDPAYSNADCIQSMIFHQLNGTIRENLDVVAKGTQWRYQNRPTSKRAPQRLDHDTFLQCYSDSLRQNQTPRVGAGPSSGILPLRQAVAFRSLLEFWDEKLQLTDERWLAFAIAVAATQTAGVPRRFGDCLSEKCVKTLLEKALQQQDNLSYREHLQRIADGKQSYYARGYIHLAKEENYQRVEEVTGTEVHKEPNLMLSPLVSARILFAWLTDPRLSPESTLDTFTRGGTFDPQAAFKRLINGPHIEEDTLRDQPVEPIVVAYNRALACTRLPPRAQ